MDVLADFFAVIADGLSMEFTVYGFTFSFMGLFLFTLFAGIIAKFIGRLFDLFA